MPWAGCPCVMHRAGRRGPKERSGCPERRAALPKPVAPGTEDIAPWRICRFRASPGAAGSADAVQTAGGPALQPQPHSRAALPQHGGESPGRTRKNREQLGAGGLKTPHALFNLSLPIQLSFEG